MQSLGLIAVALAVVSSTVAIASLIWGRQLGEQGESATNIGYIANFVTFISETVAVAVLMSAFFRLDFTFQYVAENHSTDVSNLSWLYKLSGVWAGREGSLLFWAWLVSAFVAYVAYRRLSETDELTSMSLVVANVVQIFFLVALLFPLNNPFKTSPAQWLGPDGELLIAAAMNPLLQHWAMILHPPTLFIGYAGLAIPFAYAIGALIVNDGSSTWVKLVDRITVFSWLFLGIGIGLGAIWAYVVLGWGGYWAWDPVENASLLPWLTGVGLLHSFTVYRRREGFKKWAVMMAVISFVLVLLGTFITRSGVVQSVHAFQEDPLSFWWFLGMMVLSLAAGVVGLAIRKEQFSGNDDFESLTSKEASYYFNNVVMLLAAVVVAGLTMSPAFGGKTYGPETYDVLAHPLGILYVAIMAVCPLLSWRKTEGAAFWKKAKWPVIAAAILSVPLLAIWYFELRPVPGLMGPANSFEPIFVQNFYAIVGLIVAAFAIAVSTYLFVEGARLRAKAKGGNPFSAFLHILTHSRTQSGGYLTHLGVGIILIGLVGSAMFVTESLQNIPDQPGSTFEVGDYEFVYNGTFQSQLPNGDQVTKAAFDVSKNGKRIGTAEPGQIAFYRQQQTKLDADVIVEPLHDVFVVFQGSDGENVSMQVKINPLISWTWVGFVLAILGTALASVPRKASEPRAVPAANSKVRPAVK